MTGTIDITCTVPAPTLAQVRAWLVRTGWEEDSSHHGKRSTVWWHTSALHPHGGRAGLRLTEGRLDETINHAAIVLTRIRGIRCTPESVYREIMGPTKVWLVLDHCHASGVIGAHASHESAHREMDVYTAPPLLEREASIEEHEVRT